MHFQFAKTNAPDAQKLTLILSSIICLFCQVFNGARSHQENSCPNQFQGFGVYLGSVNHLRAMNNNLLVEEVLDKLYFDLNLRFFRTSIEPEFSPSEDVYDISCTRSSPAAICSWIKVHSLISNKSRYPGTSFIASIWSPPLYMKSPAKPQLLQEYERAYYHFIKNATQIISVKFGISFEQISPVNEPENIFATWNHCDMTATQLCRLISTFNDPLISLCPENSYMSISKQFLSRGNSDCEKACEILGTHGYLLNLNLGFGGVRGNGQNVHNFGKAYYDHTVHEPIVESQTCDSAPVLKPVWMTEVSSTYLDAEFTQMQEALDLANHIINFVGTTCVQRYYYWFAFTNGPSGESLIWGRGHKNTPGLNTTMTTELYFPKKYFVYNLFTNATKDGLTNVKRYPMTTEGSGMDVKCIGFNDNLIYMNKAKDKEFPISADIKCAPVFRFCCTTEEHDLDCDENRNRLPPFSVCSCIKL